MKSTNRREFVSASVKALAGLAIGAPVLTAQASQLHRQNPGKGWRYPRKPDAIVLHLRKRDPVTGEPVLTDQRISPANVAMVVIDVWNYHWCKTCNERLNAMMPRLNRALEGARRLGIQVIFAPTDSVNPYREWPQRQAVIRMPDLPPPQKLRAFEMPGCPVGGDPCGPGIGCVLNYGEFKINSGLDIGGKDLIVDGTAEMYKICQTRGLTHLIYAGIATNMCVVGKPEAIQYMVRYGFTCYLSRDLTDAFGYPPQPAQDVSVAHIEKFACPSVDVISTLRENGFWNDNWKVDPVLISPWGKKQRPYFFEEKARSFLEQPRLEGGQIHYTLDGSEPTLRSPLYEKPVLVSQTTSLRAQAFRENRAVGLPSEAYYVKLPPMPPLPSVRLFDLLPTKANSGWADNERSVPFRMYNMRIRGKDYRKGLCVHAPSELIYRLKPEYVRLVALAGVDDSVLALNSGRQVGAFPSVTFKVYVDRQLMAESPVMRVSEGPWRFDVKIPRGSQTIKLVVTDAGDGPRMDVAGWCDVGFVIPDYQGWEQSP